MAVITSKSGGKTRTPARTTETPKPTVISTLPLSLPDEPDEPEENLEGYTLALYGEAKIGKTSFVAEFNDPLFLMFEPGGKGLRIKRRQITSWSDFVKYIDLIVKSNEIQTVAIDTTDLCYDMCTNYVCEKEVVDHINDIGYGKGQDMVDTEFKKQILRIASTGRGVVFISHVADKEFEEATGVKYKKLIPSMKDRARRFINGFADIIAYYGFFGDQRYLVISGSDRVDAGNRIVEHFLTDKGEPLYSIPMGESPKEGYENFVKAFNNELTDRGEQKRKADVSERKPSFAKKR